MGGVIFAMFGGIFVNILNLVFVFWYNSFMLVRALMSFYAVNICFFGGTVFY